MLFGWEVVSEVDELRLQQLEGSQISYRLEMVRAVWGMAESLGSALPRLPPSPQEAQEEAFRLRFRGIKIEK